MMRIAVVCAKDFKDAARLESELDRLTRKLSKPPLVYTRKGDRLAQAFARRRGLTYLVWQPSESDEEMLLEANGVVTFGRDKATEALVTLARKKGLKVREL